MNVPIGRRSAEFLLGGVHKAAPAFQRIPSATPDPLMTPARRVLQSCSVGGGEVPVVASDRERPGHDRGMKVTTDSL